MFKAVVFDMGGVIVNLDRARCIAEFTKLGFPGIEDMLDVYHQKGLLGELEGGQIDESVFLEYCRERCLPGTTTARVRAAFNSLCTGIDADKTDYIACLRGRYELYLLSNNNSISWNTCKAMGLSLGFSFDEVFREQFCSFRMKCLKPSREIYERALESIGLPAGEVLFVDDSATNLVPAAELGMGVCLYDVGKSLRDTVDAALKAGQEGSCTP